MVWPVRSKENKTFVCWLSVMNNTRLYPLKRWELQPNYYPRQAYILQIEQLQDVPSKILQVESPYVCHSADGFSSWYCGESQCESLNTSRPRVQVSRAAQHHYLSVAIQNSVLYIINQDSKEVYNMDSNMNKCHWHWPMREQLRRWCSRNIQAVCQPLLSTTLPICKTATTCHQNHMIHRNGIIPWRWNHTIPWERKNTMESFQGHGIIPWDHTMGMELYHGTIPWTWNHTMVPYHGHGIIPWNHTMGMESYHEIIPWEWNHAMGSYQGHGIIPWGHTIDMGSYHGIIPRPWNHTILYRDFLIVSVFKSS